jgi:addiction module RelB/DinJ family antitoxin
MNTKTILNVKTDKKLKAAAQKTADLLGVPLSTAVNAFLKQFVREKTLVLSANEKFQPTPYLMAAIEQAERDFAEGKSEGPFTAEELIEKLENL